MVVVSTYLSNIDTSTNTFINHFASSLADDREMNYDSIEEWVKHGCLLDFKEITSPIRVKIHAVIDLDSSKFKF